MSGRDRELDDPDRADLAGRQLERVELAGDTATPGQPHRGVRLLPTFAAFVVATVGTVTVGVHA